MMMKRHCNQYYVGELARNFGQLARAGFSVMETPAAATVAGRTRYDDYLDGGAASSVVLSRELGGVLLAPTLSAQPATLAQFTASPADCLQIWTPPNQQAAHAYSFHAEADYLTDIRAVGALPAAPSFAFSFTRAAMPPAGMRTEQQRWRLTFGGNYTLEWGRTVAPRLYRGEVLLDTLPLAEGALQGFGNAAELTFSIFNLRDNLYIYSSGWDGVWTVRAVGTLPAACYRMQGFGGAYAFNLSPYSYPTSGWFTTDWVEHWGDFPDDALVGDVFPPAQPAGTGAALCVAATRGTAKQYRVTLSGDGAHTPLVQAFQYRYDPLFLPPLGEYWQEITHWVTGATLTATTGGTEYGRSGPVQRNAELTLRPAQPVNGETLWQWVGSLHGACAFMARAGVVYEVDGEEISEQVAAMRGVLELSDLQQPVAGAQALTLTVLDRWERLTNTTLTFAPCVAGLRVDQAIALIAQWAGIAPYEIVAEVIPYTLSEPDDYTQPTWLPANGASAAEFIRKIAGHYGAVVEFDSAGLLQVRAGRTLTPVATYSLQPGGDPLGALERVEEHEARGAGVNAVVVEGRGSAGRPLFASLADVTALSVPGTPGYTGYPIIEYVRDTDLATQEAVNIACAQHFANRRSAMPQRVLTSHTADLWCRRPNEVISLINAAGDGVEHVRLTHVSTVYGVAAFTTTAVGEVA